MPTTAAPPRVIILANRQKARVTESLKSFRPWLDERATIVADPAFDDENPVQTETLPQADFAMVFGGDGTLLAQARQVVDLGIPLLGVNFGKLGFLAEFNLDDVVRHWDSIASGACCRSGRVVLEVKVYPASAGACLKPEAARPAPEFRSLAVNDAVLTAGPPFRMIEMELTIDPGPNRPSAATFSGDGVIIATPSGSTAYNLGAGGSIVSPDVDALCITPICPHTLAFRPIVVSARSEICVRLQRANDGTTLVIDGQTPLGLAAGAEVVVRRHPKDLILVHNPDLTYWTMLGKKMNWAARPRGV